MCASLLQMMANEPGGALNPAKQEASAMWQDSNAGSYTIWLGAPLIWRKPTDAKGSSGHWDH